MNNSVGWFDLSVADQVDALEVGAARSGRPAHLLEKDIWVVWTLAAIYNAPSATALTFTGGTSLSKVYKVIDRFSEDIDLTYDIRELVPDLLRDGKPIPDSPSQEKKVTRAVRERLPDWIAQTIKPRIENALAAQGLHAELQVAVDIFPALSPCGLPLAREGRGFLPLDGHARPREYSWPRCSRGGVPLRNRYKSILLSDQ